MKAELNVPQNDSLHNKPTLRVRSLTSPNLLYNARYVNRHWTCDCPSARFHPRCKHVVLLAILTKRLGGVRKVLELASLDGLKGGVR